MLLSFNTWLKQLFFIQIHIIRLVLNPRSLETNTPLPLDGNNLFETNTHQYYIIQFNTGYPKYFRYDMDTTTVQSWALGD